MTAPKAKAQWRGALRGQAASRSTTMTGRAQHTDRTYSDKLTRSLFRGRDVVVPPVPEVHRPRADHAKVAGASALNAQAPHTNKRKAT